MGAGIDQEVDFLGAVMDGMEAPEERDLVAPAMAPVIADLPRHEPGERTHPERQGTRSPPENRSERRGARPRPAGRAARSAAPPEADCSGNSRRDRRRSPCAGLFADGRRRDAPAARRSRPGSSATADSRKTSIKNARSRGPMSCDMCLLFRQLRQPRVIQDTAGETLSRPAVSGTIETELCRTDQIAAVRARAR